jgi:hypothetical protein
MMPCRNDTNTWGYSSRGPTTIVEVSVATIHIIANATRALSRVSDYKNASISRSRTVSNLTKLTVTGFIVLNV